MRLLRAMAIHLLCLVVVLLVRVGLWVTRYQRLRQLLVRPCPPQALPTQKGTVRGLARIVTRVARLVPDGSCLTQTISCQALLSWKGIPTTISVGVRKDDAASLKAHAWLVWDGRVVLQGNAGTLRNFSKILDLPTPILARPVSS